MRPPSHGSCTACVVPQLWWHKGVCRHSAPGCHLQSGHEHSTAGTSTAGTSTARRTTVTAAATPTCERQVLHVPLAATSQHHVYEATQGTAYLGGGAAGAVPAGKRPHMEQLSSAQLRSETDGAVHTLDMRMASASAASAALVRHCIMQGRQQARRASTTRTPPIPTAAPPPPTCARSQAGEPRCRGPTGHHRGSRSAAQRSRQQQRSAAPGALSQSPPCPPWPTGPC